MSGVRRLVSVLVLLAVGISIGGCATGATLPADKQMTLKNLYIAATGVYVHMRAGRFVADQLKLMGAQWATINERVPFSLRRADVTGLFVDALSNWEPVLEVYEVKPRSWAFTPGKQDKAEAQLKGYLDLYARDMLTSARAQAGGRFIAPVPVEVPAAYVPELAARGIKLFVFTKEVPGVVFYEYRWEDKRKKSTHAEFASLLYEIANTTKWDAPQAELRLMMAEIANEDTVAETEGTLLTIMDEQGNVDTDFGITHIQAELLKKLIPEWFYSQPPSPLPVPLPGGQPAKWECEKRDCA